MKKNILFLYDGRMSRVPPFLALIDYLLTTNLYNIKIISSEYDDEIDKIYVPKGVEIIHYYKQEPRKGIFSRIRNRYKRDYVFSNNLPKDIKNIEYDILWIISEKTAVKISNLLKEKKFILSTYELNDRNPRLIKKMKPIVTAAKVNIACEYNRSQIMRVWFNLDETPVVLPNKPFKHPFIKDLPTSFSHILRDKKIILYQGHISRDRNLDGICKAVSEIPDYKLVLMGDGGEYVDFLKNRYPSIIFIDYIKAPFHLNITSYARIGVVTYDYYSLNTIYCAPNKIWEYSGFSIPMLANDIPGLKNTVEKNGAGICVDMNNSESIKKAIFSIEKDYNTFSTNAKKMYDTCNIGGIIDNIIDKFYD